MSVQTTPESSSGGSRSTRPSSISLTQRLARFSALHPWRVLIAWGMVLLASFVAIGTLLGRPSARMPTSRPIPTR